MKSSNFDYDLKWLRFKVPTLEVHRAKEPHDFCYWERIFGSFLHSSKPEILDNPNHQPFILSSGCIKPLKKIAVAEFTFLAVPFLWTFLCNNLHYVHYDARARTMDDFNHVRPTNLYLGSIGPRKTARGLDYMEAVFLAIR